MPVPRRIVSLPRLVFIADPTADQPPGWRAGFLQPGVQAGRHRPPAAAAARPAFPPRRIITVAVIQAASAGT